MRRLRSILSLLTVLCVSAVIIAADVEPFPDEPVITESDRDHWAFAPLSTDEPPQVDDARWARHPVDRFVKSALDENSVAPLPAAGKATLLRRVCFDLTGLPPTPQMAEEFVNDPSPDAYERLVDRLLESPAYGERWAQHWLDLARFAETDGFEHDLVRPNAWRYRDWVIDALNRDLPFDEFVGLQIAGDQLRPDEPTAAVATGFLLCGPDMPDINLQQERRHVVLNEITATVGSVFLALQVGCAQCHDHKWDPITQYDFYRLRAFFESADLFSDHPIATAAQRRRRSEAEAAWSPADRQLAVACRELEKAARQRFAEKNPEREPALQEMLDELSESERAEHAAMRARLDELPELPALPLGRVMQAGPVQPAHVYVRGSFRRPGPEVDWRVPQVLTTGEAWATPRQEKTHPRVALADWLTNGNRALTSRVIVNRVWQWHFGVGLAASSSDFGLMGDEPTHPELLDWLARRFVAEGWSLKRLHRLLLTSETYKLASSPYDPAWSPAEADAARKVWTRSAEDDPDNGLLWRRRRMRLDGESIRDAMLLASGRLSSRRGGPSVRPPLPPEVTVTLLKNQWKVTEDEEDHRRRSVYLFVRRNLRYPLFEVFDRPDTNASCAKRYESTTATQSLVLLNSEFSYECAKALAAALTTSAADDTAELVEQAHLRILGRTASAEDVRIGMEFLAAQPGRFSGGKAQPAADSSQADDVAALADYCLALFNTNEFVYLD